MARDSFILYTALLEPIQGLPDAALGRLFRAIYGFVTAGVDVVDDDIAIPFAYIVNQLKVDAAKYDTICEKRRNAARRGGLQKAANATIWHQMAASVAYNDNENENGNDNENENENENDVCVNDNDAKASNTTHHTNDFLYILFFRNVRNAEQEADRFAAYYDSINWTLQGGERLNTADQRKAKARLWAPLDASPRFTPQFLACWASIYKVLPHAMRRAALSDQTRFSIDGATATLVTAKPIADFLLGEGYNNTNAMLAPITNKYKLQIKTF